MPARSQTLNDLIAAEIAASGPLTFARFMELALYHPHSGYYSAGRAKIGRAGDFYTNVSVGPVFGRILAGQFREMWQLLGQPEKLTLVEQGANNGQLAADVLGALLPHLPVEYWIVEPSPTLRSQQVEELSPFASTVHWAENLNALPQFTGVHFSNELVDALPFHLVRSTGETWEELFVDRNGNAFRFTGGTPTDALAAELPKLPRRPKDTLAELRPAAREWIHALSEKIHSGFVLVIDYGFSHDDLLALHRTEGTFSCYHDHRRDAKPLEDIGEKDITAHVNFTSLAEAAQEAGFRLEGYTDQYHFLVGAAENLLKSLDGPPDAASQKILRGLQTLLHPETLGTQFHYLALSKGIKNQRLLPGFHHAGNPETHLFS